MDLRQHLNLNARLGLISTIAIGVGAVCALVGLILLRLIDGFTNLFFYHQFSLVPHSPADHALGWGVVLVPVLGGLIIGVVARFGSEKIRGHGIPEAMEAILIGKSRMEPRVALLKPLSSAISIGSGGPFGAEGPIIMTGGAVGSLIAQFFHLTSAERKTLLVAGAAGGMTAVFATPVAAVLLAVEMLLFELRPRSLVPVALAAAAAGLVRPFVLGPGPFAPVAPHLSSPSTAVLLASVLVGLLAGGLAMLITASIYGVEDLFDRLPIHWMWWPALGGLFVGLGGLIQPAALGVGYSVINQLLQGDYVPQSLVALMLVKLAIWAVALGSGTSGGVLAPLLIVGGILGALESSFLPVGDRALWPLVSMAAVLAGTVRAPLMSTVFALELTGDVHALLPLLIATVLSHALASSFMRHSIMTEKVARRGHPISHEYTVDPLEKLIVKQVMTTDVVSVPASLPARDVMRNYFLDFGPRRHPAYPVVDKDGKYLGMVTQSCLLDHWVSSFLAGSADSGLLDASPIIAYDLADWRAIRAYPDESCRVAAERMVQAGVRRLAVVDAEYPDRLIGIVTFSDLLKALQREIEEEGWRERFFGRGQDQAAKPQDTSALEIKT
jgi:H+/Cl- antiporter ClcA